jgi:pectin methylesterase-like acyl-CoA thioesterase
MVFTYLLGQRLKDTLCGTKVLYKKDYDQIVRNRHYFGNFDPFGDFDLIFGAAKLNLKITEIIIRYRDREYGSTQISRFSHGWLLIKMTLFAARKLKFF